MPGKKTRVIFFGLAWQCGTFDGVSEFSHKSSFGLTHGWNNGLNHWFNPEWSFEISSFNNLIFKKNLLFDRGYQKNPKFFKKKQQNKIKKIRYLVVVFQRHGFSKKISKKLAWEGLESGQNEILVFIFRIFNKWVVTGKKITKVKSKIFLDLHGPKKPEFAKKVPPPQKKTKNNFQTNLPSPTRRDGERWPCKENFWITSSDRIWMSMIWLIEGVYPILPSNPENFFMASWLVAEFKDAQFKQKQQVLMRSQIIAQTSGNTMVRTPHLLHSIGESNG